MSSNNVASAMHGLHVSCDDMSMLSGEILAVARGSSIILLALQLCSLALLALAGRCYWLPALARYFTVVSIISLYHTTSGRAPFQRLQTACPAEAASAVCSAACKRSAPGSPLVQKPANEREYLHAGRYSIVVVEVRFTSSTAVHSSV